MIVTVLLACMYEKNTSIICRSNIQTDAVVVNQCDFDSVEEIEFINKKGKQCRVKFINTTERGLSRSRNMAIKFAWGDICVICDDDEVLDDNYEETVMQAYEKNSESILNTFSLIRKDCDRTYPLKPYKLGFRDILSTNSLQISFSLKYIQKYHILFDEKMGSGTGNGGGEENAFVKSCYKTGLPMYYTPTVIATVLPGESQYFFGYNQKWFKNFGWTSRRILGNTLGFIYITLFVLKNRAYCEDCGGKYTAYITAIKGFFEKR